MKTVDRENIQVDTLAPGNNDRNRHIASRERERELAGNVANRVITMRCAYTGRVWIWQELHFRKKTTVVS